MPKNYGFSRLVPWTRLQKKIYHIFVSAPKAFGTRSYDYFRIAFFNLIHFHYLNKQSKSGYLKAVTGKSYRPGYFGIFIVLFLVLTLQSCGFVEDLFQGGKVKKERSEEPQVKKKVEIQEVEWEDITDVEDVISEYPDKTDEKERIYDVLCLLPFSGVHKDKGRALYSGLKMASKSTDPAVNIRFTALDISRLENQPDVLREVLSTPEFDLIISPYTTGDLNQVIELSKGTGAVILSPWNTSSSVQRFSKYIQLNPGLESHFNGIVDWTSREYTNPRTLIVGHKKDGPLVEMLQNKTSDLENYYTSSNPKEDITQLGQLIISKGVKAIIIPSWRSSDEAYFLSLISTINAARESQPIAIFVLSSWMNNANINYDQFNGLNFHFTSSRFINPESQAVRRFENEYMEKYHYFADDDVYYGHDIYLMTLDWLVKYQNKIIDQIVNYDCNDCFFRYNFVEKISDGDKPYISNDHVDIISFKDFEYHRVN